jgi:hypothetical protein
VSQQLRRARQAATPPAFRQVAILLSKGYRMCPVCWRSTCRCSPAELRAALRVLWDEATHWANRFADTMDRASQVAMTLNRRD